MRLTKPTPLILPTRIELKVTIDAILRVSTVMQATDFTLDVIQRHAFNTAWRAGEVLLDHAGCNSNSLENLCTTVARDGRNAHFGHHLEQALINALYEVIVGLINGQRCDIAFLNQISKGVKRKVRVDCTCAVAEETGEVMDFAGFTRL